MGIEKMYVWVGAEITQWEVVEVTVEVVRGWRDVEDGWEAKCER